MRTMHQFLFITSLAYALTACAPAPLPTPTVAPTETPTEAATLTPEPQPVETAQPLPIESVDTAECDALQTALSTQLGFELAKQEGTTCTLVATGTGEDFGNFVDVAQSIREVFVAEGWEEDQSAMADGPTGTATSYFKNTTVAAVSVGWEPSDEANCPTDQPISACDIEPSQQNFTISIDLVKIA